MRVFMVESSAKGGLIHYAYHLCRALQREGVDTTLITSTAYELRDMPHEFEVVELLRLWDPRSRPGGNPLWRKVRRGWRGVRYILEWVRLTRYLLRTRPDVVLFSEMRFAFERRFVKYLRSRGLVLADIVHDVEVYDTRRSSDSILVESEAHLKSYNDLYAQFAALFVHDRSNYDRFLELYDVPASKVHEIPLATNDIVLEVEQAHTPESLRAELNIPPERPVVLFFGTLSKYKGVEDLIRAFPQIHTVTRAHLVIAGFPAKDVDTQALHALAREGGAEEHVSWYLDYVPNEWVATLMAISDVVVLPYRAITQSAVLQIAYACGRPVVATRVGGLPDVVEEGRSGMLAPPQDPDGLAQAINAVLRDPERAREMGEYAQHLSQTRYSWRVVAQRLRTAFEPL